MDFNIARIQTGAFSKSMVFLIKSIKSCRTFLVYFTFSVPLDFCNLLTCSVLICMLLREFSSDSKCFKCFGNFDFHLSGFWVMEFVADRILVVADRNLVVAEEILKYQMRNKSKKFDKMFTQNHRFPVWILAILKST